MAHAADATRIADLSEMGVDIHRYDEAELIDLHEARRLVTGRGGKASNYQLLQRWASPSGGRTFHVAGGDICVLLPCVWRGHKRFTTAGWVRAFLRYCDGLQAQQIAERAAERRLAPPDPGKDHERCASRLRKQGFTVN